ncbi:CoA transferase, partial [Chloroflexi bacterium]|nr:CoA transferase [Chloroflexota bacterium]
ALKILGFHDSMEEKGLLDLGLAFDSDEKKNEILDTLMSLFGTDTRERWVTALREADMVAAPVNTMLEASNDPNVVANGYVREIYHPKIQETIKIHGSPWNFSETPSDPGFAPELGEHNDEILTSLGYNESQIKEFRDNEVI